MAPYDILAGGWESHLFFPMSCFFGDVERRSRYHWEIIHGSRDTYTENQSCFLMYISSILHASKLVGTYTVLARLSLLQQSSELPFAACISRQPLRLVWTPQDKPTAMDGLRPILLAQHVTLSCASPLSGHFGHGRDWSPTPIATVVGKSPSFQSSEKKTKAVAKTEAASGPM